MNISGSMILICSFFGQKVQQKNQNLYFQLFNQRQQPTISFRSANKNVVGSKCSNYIVLKLFFQNILPLWSGLFCITILVRLQLHWDVPSERVQLHSHSSRKHCGRIGQLWRFQHLLSVSFCNVWNKCVECWWRTCRASFASYQVSFTWKIS